MLIFVRDESPLFDCEGNDYCNNYPKHINLIHNPKPPNQTVEKAHARSMGRENITRAVGCARIAWGRCSSKGFRLFAFTANKERRQLWNNTVKHYRWVPRAGSLKLCLVWSFLTMTDERAIVKLGLQTGAGSSHGHGKSPFMTL